MKKFFLFIMLVAILVVGNQLTTMAQADDAGKLGLSFHVGSSSSEVGGIYHVNDRFFINPSLSYTHQSQEVDSDKQKIKDYSIETGFFYNIVQSKQMDLFVGPKIGYVFEKRTRNNNQEKLDGVSATGVLGVRYMASDKIAIIGSVELQYLKLSGDSSLGPSSEKMTLKTTKTEQNLCVVFYF